MIWRDGEQANPESVCDVLPFVENERLYNLMRITKREMDAMGLLHPMAHPWVEMMEHAHFTGLISLFTVWVEDKAELQLYLFARLTPLGRAKLAEWG